MAYKINGTDAVNDNKEGNFVNVTMQTDTGYINLPDPPPMAGTVSGYVSGGFTPTITNTIDKFPFATDANATDVGDLTQERNYATGQQD